MTRLAYSNVVDELFAIPAAAELRWYHNLIHKAPNKVIKSALLNTSPPSPSSPAASPPALMTLLEATALLSSSSSSASKTRRPARPTHATTSHLHESGKVHLTRVHTAARHLLHHHLHLALVHAEATPHPAHASRPLRGSRRRAAARHGRHAGHTAGHHLLHLCHLLLLLLDGLAHLLLLQPVRLPGELVEAVVEVVADIRAGFPPWLVVLWKIFRWLC